MKNLFTNFSPCAFYFKNKKVITFTLIFFFLIIAFVGKTYSRQFNIQGNISTNSTVKNWQSIGPPGGRVYSVTINPQNPHVIYGESEGGVFKSTDGGMSSEWLDAFRYCPIISLLDTNLMFAGLYRTTDGGITWSKMETSGWSYTFHPTDENIIYAINGYINNTLPGKNIIVSFNKGLKWDTLVSFTHSVNYIQSTAINDSILFVIGSTKLYRSVDAGKNWNTILISLPGDLFGHYAVAKNDSVIYVITSSLSRAGNPIKLYRSTDLGEHWEVDSTGQISPNTLVIDPINSNIIYIATGDYLTSSPGDILKSSDGGNSWEKKNNGLPTAYNRYLYSLVINPVDPQTLYVGTYGWGVYKTMNGGESWERTNLTKAPVFSIYIDESDSNIIYACTIDEGVLKTTSGGLNWQSLNLGVPQTVQFPFFEITFDPNNKDIGYIASRWGLFKSIDGGNNWNLTSLLGDFDHSVYDVSIHPNSSDTVYAGLIGWLTRKDLYRSADQGETWINLRLTNGEEGIAKILFDPVNPNTIYVAAFSNGIFKSTDNGVTWKEINDGLKHTDPPLYEIVQSIAIDESNPNILYADNGGVVKTTNGGENWFRIDSALFELDEDIHISRVTYLDDKIYVSSADYGQGNYRSKGGLYVSSDEGLTWSKLGKFAITSPGPGEVRANPNNLKEIYITTLTGIYKGTGTMTSVERNKNIPVSIRIYQNYPNPFNSSTQISFDIEETKLITIKIYNILGKEVRTLIKNTFSPGTHIVNWDGTNFRGNDLPSGIYFYRFKAEEYYETKKLVILR